MAERFSRRDFLRFSASTLADITLRTTIPEGLQHPQETSEKDLLLKSAFETLEKIYGPDLENLNYHLIPRSSDRDNQLVILKTHNSESLGENPSERKKTRSKTKEELKEHVLAGTPLSALAETGVYHLDKQRRWSYQRKGLGIEVPFHTLPPTEEKWLNVDLSDQFLAAYQGVFPVYASRVSTGTERFPTPTGEYHIYAKHEITRMRGPGYDISDVPCTMYYSNQGLGYAIHGAHWHNNFGSRMSHGCVNLPLPEAEWLFDWAEVGTLVKIQD
jgi:hypothetical protein